MSSSIAARHLKHLIAIENCVQKPLNLAHGKRRQKLDRVLNRLSLSIKRLFFFIIFREWFNEKTADKVVKYYVFYAGGQEKSDKRTNKIQQIFAKLTKLEKRGKREKYLPSMESSWITTDVTDQNHKLHRIKKIENLPTKLLFHFHANSPFGLNNESLEGYTHEAILDYIEGYLNSREAAQLPLYGLSSDTRNKIHGALELAKCQEIPQASRSGKNNKAPPPLPQQKSFANYSSLFKKKIEESFVEKKSLLVPGGWTGRPAGHAMYYEIFPEEGDRATFRFYNLGEGAGHHLHADMGNKTKYLPYIDLKGIAKERLLDSSIHKIFYELQKNPLFSDGYTKTEFNKRDIYRGVVSALAPTEIVKGEPNPETLSQLKSLQGTGICSFRSFLAFLSKEIPKPESKRFVLDLQMQTLVDKVALLSKNREQNSPMQWRLIDKSYQKLSRKLGKAKDAQLVGNQYIIHAFYQLGKVARWLKNEREPSLLTPTRQTSLPSERRWSPTPLSSDAAISGDSLAETLTRSTLTHKKSHPFSIANELKILSSLPFPYQVEHLAGLEKKISTTSDYSFYHFLVIEWIQSFSSHWFIRNRFDKVQAANLITTLETLSATFFKSCFYDSNPENIAPEKIYVMMKFLFLQRHLASQLDSKLATPPGFSFGIALTQSPYFVITDGQLAEDFDWIKSYLSQPAKKAPEFYYFNPSEELKTSSTLYFRQKEGRPKSDWNYHLQELFPKEWRELLSRHPDLLDHSKSMQNAHLFSSDLLPKPIRSMLDTYLHLLYLAHEPVGKPIQGNLDTSLVYEIKEEQNYVQLHFGLKQPKGAFLEQYPSLNRTRENPYFLHHTLHRPFKDKNFEALLLYGCQNRYSEKALLADRAKKHKMTFSDETFRKIARLFESERKIRLAEIIGYFLAEPAKLRDPDYQLFFELILFKIPLITGKHAPKIAEFFSKQIKHFSRQKDIPTTVFFLRMQRHCRSFDFCTFPESRQTLFDLLEQESLDPEEKSLIYGEIIENFARNRVLTSEEIERLLEASVWLESYPIPSQWSHPSTKRATRKALHIHSKAIEEFLLPNDRLNVQFLKQLSEKMGKGSFVRWVAEISPGKLPIFRSAELNKKISYSPFEASLVCPDTDVVVPLDIREDLSYRKLFKQRKRAFLVDQDIYRINDIDGTDYLLSYEKNRLVIEQKRKGKWYRFLPQEVFLEQNNNRITTPLESSFITQYALHWRSLDDPDLIEHQDPHSKKFLYFTRCNQGKIEVVTKREDGLILGIPSPLLQHFEEEGFIHEWYEPTGPLENMAVDTEEEQSQQTALLQKVELPRYGLRFHRVEGNLYCDSPLLEKGFFLSPIQNHPFLGSFPHALVLENAKGTKKILIPKHFLKRREKKEALEPAFSLDRKVEIDDALNQKVYLFSVDEKGELHSTERLANLQLIYYLIISQEYQTAAKWLRKYGPKLTLYTKEEREIFIEITKIVSGTGDEDPNAKALRLFCYYLLCKNGHDHHRALEPEIFQQTGGLLQEYLTYFSQLTAIRLTKREELFLIKKILENTFISQFYTRYAELDPKGAGSYRRPPHPARNPFPPVDLPSFISLRETIQSKVHGYNFVKRAKDFSIEEALITRFSSYVKRDFFSLYDIAIQGSTEQKKWLHESLLFLSSPGDMTLGAFFETILKNPRDFPLLPLEENDREAWWSDVFAVAHRLGTEVLKEWTCRFSQAIREEPSVDATPAGFLLDRVSEEPPPIAISYRFAPFTSWREITKKAGFFQERVEGILENTPLGDWLGQEKQRNASDGPLYEKQIEALETDRAYYQTHAVRKSFALDENKKEELESLVQADETVASKEADRCIGEILECANVLPENLMESLERRLCRNGQQEKVLTLDEILVYYGRKDIKALQKRNPALTENAIQDLFDKVGRFLLTKTAEQQRQRARRAWELYRKATSEEEKQEHLTHCAEQLLAKRAYKPQEQPAYLVFEYHADILMRKTQVAKLATFLRNGDANPIMEMIMGSGKSKVLLPLLGLLRADGEAISTIIVPSSLFASISSDTQSLLSNTFLQPLRALHFDRNTLFTRENLTLLRDDLIGVKEEKECLIVTSKSLQCFLLKYIEKWGEFCEYGSSKEELELMQEILDLLRAHCIALIDEADIVLRVLHEVCFSLGKKSSPNPEEVEVLSHLYSLLYTDPAIHSLVKIESDPTPSQTGSVLTEENYGTTIQPLLADRLIDSLKNYAGGTQERIIQDFFKNLSAEERQTVLAYLCHDALKKEEAQQFYLRQQECIRDVLALAAEEISKFLRHTLTRICNENYGLDQKHGGTIATPFSAANAPNPGSQFANPYITMNYTFQYYMREGVSVDVVKHEIERLQTKAMAELKEGIALEDTESWKTFCRLCGRVDIPFFHAKEREIEQVTEEINKTKEKKIAFVKEILLPQLEIYEKKASCNPHNLVALLKRVAGFTGTLWNSHSMHTKLSPQGEAGTDTKTLELLFANSRNEVYTLAGGSPEKIFRQIDEQGISFTMISDAGGYFKEGGNPAIAKVMAQRYKRPIVFYNQENHQAETDGEAEVLLSDAKTPYDQRKVFLDQSHTTGADVRVRYDAIGLVTIGRNMLFRDLLQSVWRLRSLDKGQRVKFILDNEVDLILRDKLSIAKEESILLDHIVRFTLLNQIDQQGKENFKGLLHELKGHLQFLLISVLLSDSCTEEEKKKTFIALEEEWIQKAHKPPRELYGALTRKEKRDLVLEDEKKKYLDKVETIFQNLPFLEAKGFKKSALRDAIETTCHKLSDFLPEDLPAPLRDLDDDQTVEIEEEAQTETETEIETQENRQEEEIALGYRKGTIYLFSHSEGVPFSNEALFPMNPPKESDPVPFFSIEDFWRNDPVFGPYAGAFAGIMMTMNVPEWPKNASSVKSMKLFGNCRTPFQFIAITSECFLLLSQKDARNISAHCLYHTSSGFQDPRNALSKEDFSRVVKVKFLNGESTYTKKERKILEEWLKREGVSKMRELYTKHILQGMPELAARYANSQLKEIFKKLENADK